MAEDSKSINLIDDGTSDSQWSEPPKSENSDQNSDSDVIDSDSAESYSGDIPSQSSVQADRKSNVESEDCDFVGRNTVHCAHYAFSKKKNGSLVRIQVFYDPGSEFNALKQQTVSDSGSTPKGVLPKFDIYVPGAKKTTNLGRCENHSLPI